MAALSWCIFFRKKSGRRPLVGPEIVAFVCSLAIALQFSKTFPLMLDCFTPNCKLKYEDFKKYKADHVDTVVFNLYQIKHRTFLGHQVYLSLLGF